MPTPHPSALVVPTLRTPIIDAPLGLNILINSGSPLTLGEPEPYAIFPPTATTAQYLAIQGGTIASPDTEEHPLVKVVRRLSFGLAGGLLGDGGEQLAAGYFAAIGDASNRVQPVALYVASENAGTANLGSGKNADTVSLYAQAISRAGNVGVAIPIYLQARHEDTGGKGTGVEIQLYNESGVADTASLSAFNQSQMLWLNANGPTTDGTSDGGSGIVFGNPWGVQIKYGLNFLSQTVAGKSGAIRSDGSAIVFSDTGALALDIRGAHGTASYQDSSTSPFGISLTGTFASGALHVSSNSGTTNTVNIGTTHVDGRKLNVLGTRNTTIHGAFLSGQITHAGGAQTLCTGATLAGVYGTAGTGTLSLLCGGRGIAQITAAVGGVTDLASLVAVNNTTTGVVPTRASGLYIENQTAGATNYGIYSLHTGPSLFSGSVVCASGALATNATEGFLYVPTCAGTPTGVPTSRTGTVALVFDTTNNKLYIYDGGWLGGTTPGAFV